MLIRQLICNVRQMGWRDAVRCELRNAALVLGMTGDVMIRATPNKARSLDAEDGSVHRHRSAALSVAQSGS